MKIGIVGAGAVGGVFAIWLGRQPEHTISVFARSATLTALQRDGLVLESADGSRRAVSVRASADAAALGPQDLVIVAVKGPALAAVAPAVARLAAGGAPVVVAMNGVPWWFFDHLEGPCRGLRLASVDPGDAIRAQIPTGQVIGCVVHMSSVGLAPGVVRHAHGQRLILGEPAGGASGRLEGVAQVLRHAGFEAETSARIQHDIWFKLWGNMTVNPVSALTGATGDQILDDPLVRAYLSAMMLEAREIGGRFGVPIEQTPEERHVVTRKLGAFRTSMLQDAEAGRPLELDALLGVVCEIGRHVGVPTPHLDSLLGLTRLMARTRGLAPGMTPG